MTKEESTKTLNFDDPLGRGSCAGAYMYSENTLVYTRAWNREMKTNYVYSN